MKEFDEVLSRIANGRDVAAPELLPYLCLETREQRCEVNAMLALAYSRGHTPEHIRQAKVFIQRAWNLSGFSADLLPVYIKIFSASDDIAGICDAYKRLGMKMAAQGNISETIRYFDLWQNAYANSYQLDRYEYDFDVIDCMDRLAQPHRFAAALTTESLHGRKIRLAYLLKGIADLGSVLVKIKLLFAKYHDRSRFEITFFAPESESFVQSCTPGLDHIKQFDGYKCEVIMAPSLEDTGQGLLALAKRIYESKPDILMTSASLANFSQYFITALRPASVIIGFNQGPQPQFVSPNIDWCIAWTKHHVIDCIVGNSLVSLETDLPNRDNVVPFDRNDFDIPEDAVILFSGGRNSKFQDMDFWRAIMDVLSSHPNAYYLVVGVQECQIPFLESLLSPETKTRVRVLGWRGDYLRILRMADLAIDTYPSGGGVVLMDAMSLGIPVVSFENNYLRPFDQTDWSVAQEIVNVADLIAPRGDFGRLKQIVYKLITDQGYRCEKGRLCKDHIFQTHGNPERMVRRCEEVSVKVLEDKQRENESVNDLEEAYVKEKKVDLALGRFKIEALRQENFEQWQKAYEDGYNSSMGDHRSHFYNEYLGQIGYYHEISRAKRIVEYAPGSGEFLGKSIQAAPEKEFTVIDISEANLALLKSKFSRFLNIRYVLNNQRCIPVRDVDSVFSFLLCQSVPRSLWIEHLAQVYDILVESGSYVFQFAYHPGGVANDCVADAISGSQKYSADDMVSLVRAAGFRHVELTEPINLEPFNTDIVWYLCKAAKVTRSLSADAKKFNLTMQGDMLNESFVGLHSRDSAITR
jgi:glycosyltransferase involved in cell wall biosynthesis/SAM-dependent methyltransferase